jgi:hypothetical protein
MEQAMPDTIADRYFASVRARDFFHLNGKGLIQRLSVYRQGS